MTAPNDDLARRVEYLERELAEERAITNRVQEVVIEAFLANEPIRPERLRDVLNGESIVCPSVR